MTRARSHDAFIKTSLLPGHVPMKPDYDAIIIGGGHNGLTSAAYLAKRGKSVLVLEKRHIVGGAAATEEFAPGIRNSSCSFVVGYLRPEIIRDLGLDQYGLEIKHIKNEFFPFDDGRHMLMTDDPEHNEREIARFSDTDNEGLRRLRSMLSPLSEFFAQRMLRRVPSANGGLRSMLEWAHIGLELLRLSREDRFRLVKVMTQSASDILGRYLESEQAKLPNAFGAISVNSFLTIVL